MKRAMIAACVLMAVAAGPATKPVEEQKPLDLEAALKSVPPEFAPKDKGDDRELVNAATWLTRNYSGRTVELSGKTSKPVVRLEGNENVVTFKIFATKPNRWLSEELYVYVPIRLNVDEAEAKRISKLGAGARGSVRIAVDRFSLGKSLRSDVLDTKHQANDTVRTLTFRGEQSAVTIR